MMQNPTTNTSIKPQHIINSFQQKAMQLHSELIMKDAYILQLSDDLSTALKSNTTDESALQLKANEMKEELAKKDEYIKALEKELANFKAEKKEETV